MGVDPACLICLKILGKATANKFCPQDESLFRKFVLLSERLFGLPETFISTFSWTTSRTTTERFLCPDCETVISDTCKLYQDLSALQLKLGWKLKHLQASIRSHNQLSPKLRTVLHRRVATQLELPGGPEQVRDIHRQISRHCCQVAMSQREVFIPLNRIPDVKGKATTFVIPPPDPDENFATDIIKFENEIAMAEQDEDELSFSFDYTQEVDSSPEPTGFQKELVNQQASPEAMVPSLATAKLRPRKAALCNTQRNVYQHLKSVKKAKKRKKPARRKAQPSSTDTSNSTELSMKKKRKPTIHIPSHLWYIDDGRDPAELTCRICTKKSYVPNCLRRLRTHLCAHENRWRKRNPTQRPPLQCYFCFWTFRYEQSLRVHLESYQHTLQMSRGKFICSEGNCDNIEFRNFSDFDNHFESDHHNQTLFRCDLCSWPFLSDEMRQVHGIVHQKVKWGDFYDCSKCDERTSKSAISAQNHYIKKHTTIAAEELLVYTCSICNLKCKYQHTFREPMRTHEMESEQKKGIPAAGETFSCDHCGRSYPSRRLLTAHRARVRRGNTQCPKCGKIVTNLGPHLKEFHKEGEPIPCPECGKIFTSKKGIKQHLFKVHNPERPRVNPCPICPKVYQRLPLLNVHLRDVHQIVVEALQAPPKFICPDCGKGYFNKSSLDSHVITKHSRENGELQM